MNMASKLNAIVLDIEGTTTSISFVKDILFPYAREHLDSFLAEHWGSEGCTTIINLLRDQASADGVALKQLNQTLPCCERVSVGTCCP